MCICCDETLFSKAFSQHFLHFQFVKTRPHRKKWQKMGIGFMGGIFKPKDTPKWLPNNLMFSMYSLLLARKLNEVWRPWKLQKFLSLDIDWVVPCLVYKSTYSYIPGLCQIVGKWLFLLSCEYFFEFPVGPPPGAAPIKPPWTDPRLRFDAAKRMSGDPFLLDPFPPPPPDP